MRIDQANLKLRKASLSDIDLLIDHRIIFLTESYGQQNETVTGHLRKTLRDYLQKSFANGSFISWIAEYNGKPVGFSGLVIREQPGNFDIPNGRTGYILNMFTLKEFRENGIGSLLFGKLIEETKLLKLDRLDLHATTAGEPVYRKFGFTEPHDKVLELIL
jgi:GNAT superfamily N-acetyltransferase